jgi:hypothetical protein
MMSNFHTFIARYGEPTVQDLIERIERREGACRGISVSLEDRWNALMRRTSTRDQSISF